VGLESVECQGPPARDDERVAELAVVRVDRAGGLIEAGLLHTEAILLREPGEELRRAIVTIAAHVPVVAWIRRERDAQNAVGVDVSDEHVRIGIHMERRDDASHAGDVRELGADRRAWSHLVGDLLRACRISLRRELLRRQELMTLRRSRETRRARPGAG